jgi:cytochrome c556
MTFSFKTLAVAAFAAAFVAGGVAVTAVAQDAKMAHEKRTGLMKLNGQNLGGYAKAAKEGDKAAALAAAKVLVANSQALGDAALWPAGSGGGDTRAKPEIWDNMDDFKAKLAAFQQAAAAAEEAATGGGDMAAAFAAVRGACGGCHTTYQAPKS